jgi:hypothetical protein
MTSNPYQAPAALPLSPAPPPYSKRDARWPFYLLAAAGAGFMGSCGVLSAGGASLAQIGFAIATLVALGGSARAVVALVHAARSAAPRGGAVGKAVFALLANLALAGFGALAALLATATFTRGRQLRRFGRVLLPRLAPGQAWTRESSRLDVDAAPREALAAQWRENARTEHASVAAFARLTLDLAALGAPPALLAAAQNDALDEIRHAQMCLSLARALDGKDFGFAPFPEAQRARTLPRFRPFALAALAVDSLIDGALHEGVSARVVAQLARRAEPPAVRALLKQIAADEGRHARHGWDVVEWCVAEGGDGVVEALRGAMRALPATMRSPLPAAAEDGGWERWGIHGHALEAEQHARARAQIAARVESLVASRDLVA